MMMHQWQALLEQPLEFVGTASLAVCFPSSPDAVQLSALRKLPRFRERLLRLLLSGHGLQAPANLPQPAIEELPVLLLAPRDFKRFARLCGAIVHGTTLSREIRGNVVSQLRDLLGNDVFVQALAHRGLGSAADLLRQPGELLEIIDRDGARCVWAWLQAQPTSFQPWLRLRFSELQQPDPAPLSVIPPEALTIVRRAAVSLQQPAERRA